jgi:hypothetical protein
MDRTVIKSICILGRQPALGLAELESLYGANQIMRINRQVAGLTLHASDIDFERLGGSTRLAHVMTTFPGTDWKTIERKLPELLIKLALTLPDGKIQLGLSSFGLNVSAAKLNAMGLELKKTLRTRANRSVRVTPNPQAELNTAQVLHNHLAGPTGIELLLIAGEDNHTTVARTTRVQDIDSYTVRDRGRPRRDARVGMLPPKLAQIIINLAGKHTLPPEATFDPDHPTNKHAEISQLLDPFCGTGVILQEALRMGYTVYGTDLEERMVSYSQQNLEWFTENNQYTGTYRLETGDATTFIWRQPIDLIACETYLGRPFTEQPRPEILAKTMSEANLIIKKFLTNIHSQLEPGVRLCLAVPAWQTANHQFKHLPLIDQISYMGYNRLRFEHVRDEELLYYREDQIVARELLVITRK